VYEHHSQELFKRENTYSRWCSHTVCEHLFQEVFTPTFVRLRLAAKRPSASERPGGVLIKMGHTVNAVQTQGTSVVTMSYGAWGHVGML
jgi:hypothetical protein